MQSAKKAPAAAGYYASGPAAKPPVRMQGIRGNHEINPRGKRAFPGDFLLVSRAGSPQFFVSQRSRQRSLAGSIGAISPGAGPGRSPPWWGAGQRPASAPFFFPMRAFRRAGRAVAAAAARFPPADARQGPAHQEQQPRQDRNIPSVQFSPPPAAARSGAPAARRTRRQRIAWPPHTAPISGPFPAGWKPPPPRRAYKAG